MAHEEFLAIKICQGLRPRFNIKVPQVIDDMAKQCVDADPSKDRLQNIYLKNLMNAVYTSRLLNFPNLPEPKNSDDEELYSESIEAIDFTKLNINL
ncbi:hypothetical protein C1645_821792 [Glomus cerebriforme]|uniref:Serine-threonine/tyrosine-protein kinase catalytic domain-containing protein n=1 Tax=Glomus cerebriforme TaxID=658196 RepID=A0A397T998_9GLOM|nr:hypothetical protein C1645_821792 [Glomus cerebriforme]